MNTRIPARVRNGDGPRKHFTHNTKPVNQLPGFGY